MTYDIVFYQSASGKEEVINFIMSQKPKSIIKIKNAIKLLQEYGLKLLNTNWVKKVKQKPAIYELRIKTDIIYRILFLLKKPNSFILLHIFIKKTNKTPSKEIKIALHRARKLV